LKPGFLSAEIQEIWHPAIFESSSVLASKKKDFVKTVSVKNSFGANSNSIL